MSEETQLETIRKYKTHCTNGHELTPENSYIDPRRGWRSCETCRKSHKQAFELRKAAKKERDQ